MTRCLTSLALCCLLLGPNFAVPAPLPADTAPRTLVAAVPAEKGAKIVTVNASTGSIKDLSDGRAVDSDPAWSPDGRRIAFISNRDGVNNLYVMLADGSKVEQLTRGKVPCGGPRWSPDGKRIAFLSGLRNREQISLIDRDGGHMTQLTKGPFSCRQPAWSPDGKKLSYSQYGPGIYGTWVIGADGSGATNLTAGGGGLDAAWSPDGKRIAFTSVRNGGGFRLYVMDADGKNVAQRSTTAHGGNVYPAWSPDGKRIAFGDPVNGKLQVRVCDPDEKTLTTLTKTAANGVPRWSPDGKKISFARFEANKPVALWVMDADGRNERQLLPATSNGWADWRPK